MPQPVATTHRQDDSVTPNKPVDPGLVQVGVLAFEVAEVVVLTK